MEPAGRPGLIRDAAGVPGVLRVALCGNPNSGKTTLFNALTGLHHKVANYPGVTVERVTGSFQEDGCRVEVHDIPGTYSLCAHSPDEAIAAEVLSGEILAPPDVTVVVIDAVRLERGLYLLSQVADLGRPMVVALNMYDLAQRRGLRIDHRALSERLGVPVVPVVAHRSEGLLSLKRALLQPTPKSPNPATLTWPLAIEASVLEMSSHTNGHGLPPLSQGEARRLLFDEQPPHERRAVKARGEHFVKLLAAARERARAVGGSGLEARLRTQWARDLASQICERPGDLAASWTSRLDRFLLHRLLGPVIAVLLLLVVFQALFSWAQPAMAWVDGGVALAGDAVRSALPPGPLQSLLADGVVGGVGAVLVFLPQILILFLFIGLLEDSGYLPRAAFLADRVFRGCGLTGRSLIPLLSSFACAVPGILATRTIDQRSQRFLTIAVAPLMTCSARLPVYAVLIAAFVPAAQVVGFLNLQGLTLAALYVLGLAVAALVALVLKNTVLRGKAASFVMELPSYRLPNLRNILSQMYTQGREFTLRAGTVILALTIVLWALSYYPRAAATLESAQADGSAAQVDSASDQLAQSYLGRAGRWLEPAAMHLGWDWRISVAVLASFPAREVIISTLGTLFHLGDDASAESTTMIQRLREARWEYGPLSGTPLFSIPVALSVMVFFALCCQCMATLATIRRETNSWRWPAFVFSYMTVLAVVASWAVYHLGTLVGWAGIA